MPLIQLRQLLRQGVQVIQTAGVVQERGQLLKVMVLCDLPIRRLILRQPELVKGVLQLIRRGGERQLRIGVALRLILLRKINIEHFIQ